MGMSESDISRLTQAAAWRARLTENDLEGCPELSVWLAEDARKIAAWKRVQDDWALFAEHARSPELLELRSKALAHAHAARPSRWVRSRWSAITHPLSIAAGILILAFAWLFVWMKGPDFYTTGAGKRRVVSLADGSRVALDSRSEVSVQYSAHARELKLIKGQALFDVAHDIERPFSVIADGHKVTATGTSFNVDLFGPNLLVTLIEGRVVVSATSSSIDLTKVDIPVSRITLDAGEQVVFSPQVPPSVARVNLRQATAWESGKIVSEDDSLATVVARINRYAQHAIIIGDTQTGELRISGVFRTDDIEGFVSTIMRYLPVRAEKQTDGTTRLTHR
jgi:transmembrane sensor